VLVAFFREIFSAVQRYDYRTASNCGPPTNPPLGALNMKAVLNCPHCGKASTYDTRGNQNAAIVVNCRHCRSSFYIQIRNGDIIGVRE